MSKNNNLYTNITRITFILTPTSFGLPGGKAMANPSRSVILLASIPVLIAHIITYVKEDRHGHDSYF